jgi:hypothetical protein
VTYGDADDLTQRQAFGVIELIQRLQAEGRITPAADVAVIGISWGGLIARYALQYMETHGPAHNVDLWITGDSPLQGAYIPIGIQHVGNYFGADVGVKSAATSMAEMLDLPSTKQLLIYHYTRTGLSGETWAPEFTNLFTVELKNALGGFPHAEGLRRVGVSDGRADGKTDGPAPGAQIMAWSSPTVDIVGTGKAYPFDNGLVSGTATPEGTQWRVNVVVKLPIINTTVFNQTFVVPVKARVNVRALALTGKVSATVFEAHPKFSIGGSEIDVLDEASVIGVLKPFVDIIVHGAIPSGIATKIWDDNSAALIAKIASPMVAAGKAKVASYPWLKVRDIAINAPYSYDGGPGGRSDKSGVLIDLVSKAGIGTITGASIRSHSFIPIHSALMLENTPGVPFDPASVAARLGQAPKTPFDRIVYATTNLGHLDSERSLFPTTVVTEATELVQRGGG